jgi:hypothetical protein
LIGVESCWLGRVRCVTVVFSPWGLVGVWASLLPLLGGCERRGGVAPSPPAEEGVETGHEVFGKVLCRGEPLTRASIEFFSRSKGRVVGQVFVRTDGSYELKNLPLGKVDIYIRTTLPLPMGPLGHPPGVEGPRPGGLTGPPGYWG